MGFHVGQIFGDYSILAQVGAGSMGRVYKVEHCLTRRTEAMKVLSAELATEIQIKRFEREMRSLARLSHPNIAALHNAIHSENQLILLMEFIEGETLESKFSAGRLPLNTGVEYIRQILLALGYAHRLGVVHRDVTPANVLVTAAGQVKLTDFGLSKSYGDSLLTNCGEVLGSLPYLAPEQLKGVTQPDRRSDVYAVGAILYEHLTGQKPFGPKRRLAAAITDSEGEPSPPSQMEPSLSPEWDEVIGRALDRDPMKRYQSADEFLDAIAEFDQPTAADLPLPQPRTLGIGIALFAGLVLALAASPVLNQFRRVTPVIVPWHGLHVPPPAFATKQVPSGRKIVRATTPRRVKTPTAAVAISPKPTTAVVAINPKPATAAVPPASTPAVTQAAAPEAEESTASQEQDTTPEKRGFWSKLNVFKKKTAESKERP